MYRLPRSLFHHLPLLLHISTAADKGISGRGHSSALSCFPTPEVRSRSGSGQDNRNRHAKPVLEENTAAVVGGRVRAW
ncbi:hypothetical protein C8T65DRAFT_644054 [Cerioporus squamosus]|nr:hypothetical protein C8T65DRAFT_643956 [Cerioporus squamosus]KAI0715528.1 hypothetical protein C8T65DRAFT_644054 [Cerioporus squamosus]